MCIDSTLFSIKAVEMHVNVIFLYLKHQWHYKRNTLSKNFKMIDATVLLGDEKPKSSKMGDVCSP